MKPETVKPVVDHLKIIVLKKATVPVLKGELPVSLETGALT